MSGLSVIQIAEPVPVPHEGLGELHGAAADAQDAAFPFPMRG